MLKYMRNLGRTLTGHAARRCHNQIKVNDTRIKDLIHSETTMLETSHDIHGWITNIRKLKKVTFLELNDGTCTQDIQVVVSNKLDGNFNVGSPIKVYGVLGQTPKGQLELQANDIQVINTCKHPEYPLTPKQNHLPQYVRQFLHLRSRHKPFAATMRVRHSAQKGFHDFFDSNGYLNIHTPVLTANDCEGSGEVFLVRPESEDLLKEMQREHVAKDCAYFDKKSYLTVSGQLHLESMCLGFDKVYTFNPAFRAENCKSPHHLSEFYMIEAEIAFMNQLEEITKTVEKTIKDVTKIVLEKSSKDIETLVKSNHENFKSLDDQFSWIDKSFPVLSYSDAVKILKMHSTEIKIPVKQNEGLVKDHELFLTKHLNSPLFVAYFPTDVKPFYMKRNDQSHDLVDCFDLLVPEVGELVGGSVRELNLDQLEKRIPNTTELEWYTDLRRYGSACTSGYGLGFERYLQWMLHIKNIRDVIPFPRWAHHCDT